jgi:hypothetical protein
MPALTTFDKALLAVGPLIVAVCAAAGVDASRPVEALTGLALVLLPVFVFYKANRGLNYQTISKALAALPAPLAGVFLLFGIDAAEDLERIGSALLAFIPFAVAMVGNEGAVALDYVPEEVGAEVDLDGPEAPPDH